MLYEFIKSNKSFLFLWLAQVFSQTSICILNFVLAISIYSETKSNLAVSILLIVYGIPAFLFSVISGVFVDRFDRKKTMAFVNLSRAFIVLVFLFLPQNALMATLLFAFVMSTLTQFFFPAEGAIIPNIVRKKNLIIANSLYSSTFFITQVVGYLFAGPLLKAFSYKSVLLFLFALFFISTVLVWAMGGITFTFMGLMRGFINKLKPRKDILDFVREDVSSARLYIGANKGILNTLIILGLTQVVTVILVSLMPGLGFEVLGINASDVSLYLVGPAVLGAGVGAFVVSRLSKRFSSKALLNCGIVAGGFVVFLLSLIRRVPLDKVKYSLGFLKFAPLKHFLSQEFVRFLGVDMLLFAGIVLFLIGVFGSFVIVVGNATMQKNCENSMRGKMYGLLQMIVTAGSLIPVLLGGVFADLFGVLKVIGAMGLLITIAGIIRIFKWR